MGPALRQARQDMANLEKKYGRAAVVKNSPYHQMGSWKQPIVKGVRAASEKLFGRKPLYD